MPARRSKLGQDPDPSQVKTAVPTSPLRTKIWPALPTHSHRVYPLEINQVLASQILLIPDFFPVKTCIEWVRYLQSGNIPLAPTLPARKGEAQRTNHRFSVNDEVFAAALWEETGLRDILQEEKNVPFFRSSGKKGAKPVGLNPNIRVSRCNKVRTHSIHHSDLMEYALIFTPNPSEDLQIRDR